MTQAKKRKKSFKELLEKYLEVKGLDIIVVLEDGEEVELYKNRSLINDVIVTLDKWNNEKRIPLSEVISVDMYAA
ncbi:MAG: hypothetical protein GY754_37785 [bacterium]|nr:hypothetical protein [bacterium]